MRSYLGHQSVWQFWSKKEEKINYPDRYWTETLDRPGTFQIGYLKMLIESRPQLDRIPYQAIIVKGQGEKGERVCAFRDSIWSYLMFYISVGKTITINCSFIKSKIIDAWWFNPRTADIIEAGSISNKGLIDFYTPSLGLENDWVLIIDNPKFRHSKPDFK